MRVLRTLGFVVAAPFALLGALVALAILAFHKPADYIPGAHD